MSLLHARPLIGTADDSRMAVGPSLRPFHEALAAAGLFPLRATGIDVLQVNLGKRCNQTCAHCHVSAGPDRREIMSEETIEDCLRVLADTEIPTLDITGGAPELHPSFERLVTEARALGRRVIDRCNLTVLLTGGHVGLPEFLATHRVEVVASLPYYLAEPTDAQRGLHVFSRSIEALRRLNAVGYGVEGSGLVLNLVYNPGGAYLPPAQDAIEIDFRRELARRHDVTFTSLFTITNMPIGRFRDFLERTGNLDRYLHRLALAFNAAAASHVMCRRTVSVGWDGTLYDCDFNQMMEIPVRPEGSRHIRLFSAAQLAHREIALGSHCYGCTAGAGSSCSGATAPT